MTYQDFADNRPQGRPALYPWRTMEVGDSFFAPGKTTEAMRKTGNRYRPMKFKRRTVFLCGIRGVRVWRIA